MGGMRSHSRSSRMRRLLTVIFFVPILFFFVKFYGKLFSVHHVPKLPTRREIPLNSEIVISGSKRKPLFLVEGPFEETGGERDIEREVLGVEGEVVGGEIAVLGREREVRESERSEGFYIEERENGGRELNGGGSIGEEGSEEREKWEGLGRKGIEEWRGSEGGERGAREVNGESGGSGGRGEEGLGGEDVESRAREESGEGVEVVVGVEGEVRLEGVDGERGKNDNSGEKEGREEGGEIGVKGKMEREGARGDFEVRGKSGVGVGREGEGRERQGREREGRQREGRERELAGRRAKGGEERDLGHENLEKKEKKERLTYLEEERGRMEEGESKVEILREMETKIQKVDKKIINGKKYEKKISTKANLVIKMFHEKGEREKEREKEREGGGKLGEGEEIQRESEMRGGTHLGEREKKREKERESPKLDIEISRIPKISKIEEIRAKKKESEEDDTEPEKDKKKVSDSEEFFFGQIPSNSIGRVDLGQVLNRKEMKDFAIHPTYKYRNSFIGKNCTTRQICPNFGFCEKDGTGAVAMCRNTHLNNGGVEGEAPLNMVNPSQRDKQIMLPFEGNVWVLENVYTSKKGHIFNKTHFFLHGGCIYLDGFEYPENTQVTTFEVLANMISWNAAVNYYHSIVEGMHDFVIMRAVLDRFKDVPVAFRKVQDVGPLKKVVTVVGADVASLNLQLLGDDLFFAKKMIVPAGQVCGRPAGSVIQNVRKNLKVPTLLKRSPESPLWERTKNFDWQIVIAQRHKKRELANHEKFLKEMEMRYGKRRVKSFWGNITMSETIDFFKKTILYIGVHGAGLTNLYFMPKNSAVLELRPNEFINPCLQFLANRCELDYYMMVGKGNSSSSLEIDLNEVLGLVEKILPPTKAAEID